MISVFKTWLADLKNKLVEGAYTLSRHSGFGVVFILEYFPMLIPAHRLLETETLLAFEHPRPSYPVHILIVPRRSIPSLASLSPQDNQLLVEVIAIVQQLVVQLNLAEPGYRLIVNGGKFQEFPQLHFHLVSAGKPGPQ